MSLAELFFWLNCLYFKSAELSVAELSLRRFCYGLIFIIFRVHKAYKVQVVCETTEGSLECREESVDFGEVICGNRQTKTLTLFNSSNVNVNFRLAYSARVEGDYEDEEVLTDKPGQPKIGQTLEAW